MQVLFINSKTAIINANTDEFSGNNSEIEQIAKVLHQYGNVKNCSVSKVENGLRVHFSFDADFLKYAATRVMYETAPGVWEADPEYYSSEEESQEFREKEQISPEEELKDLSVRYKDVLSPEEEAEYDKRIKELIDLKNKGAILVREKNTDDTYLILKAIHKPGTHKEIVYIVQDSAGNRSEVSSDDLKKRFVLPQDEKTKIPVTLEDLDTKTITDVSLHEINKDLSEKHPLTGEMYDNTEVIPEKYDWDETEEEKNIDEPEELADPNNVELSEPEKTEKRREDRLTNTIQENIKRRVQKLVDDAAVKMDKYESNRGIRLTDSQKRSILDKMLVENNPEHKNNPEKAEEILNMALTMLKDKTKEIKPDRTDFLKKRKKYVDQIPKNMNFKNKIETAIEKNEKERGISYTDNQKKMITDKYLEKWNMNPKFYYEWINKTKPIPEEAIGREAFTVDGLIRLGFDEKTAADLGSLLPGEEKELLDKDTGGRLSITKTLSDTGEELYTVKDDDKETAYSQGNPELQKIESEDTVEIENQI